MGLAEGSGEARVTLPREVGDMLRIMDVIVFPSGLYFLAPGPAGT